MPPPTVGIVILLDEAHAALVREVWAELESEFGVRAEATTVPYPHLTLQIADRYEIDPAPALERIAGAMAPFTVETAGLGVFTGNKPVLHVPVIRGPELGALQLAVHEALAPVAHGLSPYFDPRHWMPHITLALDDLSPGALPGVIELLAPRKFEWHIAATRLTVLTRTEAGTYTATGGFPFGSR